MRLSSIDCKDLLCQLHRYGCDQSKITAVDDSESLSDIDDEELGKYINSKEEIRYKKALWEEINREQTKIKGTKRAAEAKKTGPVKKAIKVIVEAENQKVKAGNKKGRSSKINYDALEKLEEELGLPQNVSKESANPRSNRNLQSNATLSTGREDFDGESIQGDEYGEDATYGDNYNGYGGEEYGNDEGFYDEY